MTQKYGIEVTIGSAIPGSKVLAAIGLGLIKKGDSAIADAFTAAANNVDGVGSTGVKTSLNLISEKAINKANHLFGSKNLSKHKLESVLKDFGGDQIKAYNAIKSKNQNLADTKIIDDIFESSINLNGKDIIVRGRVIDGKVDLSTAFIK